jgi:hypothetical protein
MTALVYICSLLLAALMGFAVHRASLCTVKTVAEIFSSRKAYMMATLLKAVLWVATVSVPILVYLPETAAPNPVYAITVTAIGGGFLPLDVDHTLWFLYWRGGPLFHGSDDRTLFSSESAAL